MDTARHFQNICVVRLQQQTTEACQQWCLPRKIVIIKSYYSLRYYPPFVFLFPQRGRFFCSLSIYRRRLEAFSDWNIFVSGSRLSEYTVVKQQTMPLDKFNELAEKYNRAVSFVECWSKLSCETHELRQSRRGETRHRSGFMKADEE